MFKPYDVAAYALCYMREELAEVNKLRAVVGEEQFSPEDVQRARDYFLDYFAAEAKHV